MKLQRLRLYLDTVRHLRPVQIHGRLRFALTRPVPDPRPAPPLRTIGGYWAMPARRRPSMTGPGRFLLLNELHDLGETGWDDPGIERLWRYNLHYFDDLNAEGAPDRAGWHRDLILRWIGDNPPGRGSGWEPYPLSLRMVNWIKWHLAGNELPPAALHSLAVQARWLMRRLEFHLLGNHLFANAKALVFAGCFFRGDEADAWLARGLAILRREVPEQILADGGQFELSPMYHALALEDMLDLANLLAAAGIGMDADWGQRIGRMRDWLAAMCHPDGEISFFNDAAIGVAPPPAELERYARDLGFPGREPPADGIVHLAGSGHVRLQQPRAVALLDVARVGPDYLPGHAHADTLSFELSVDGRRCLVNSGTSVYGAGPERLRQRGTAAHNTVEVDGENSSEVWSGFRVARRAHPFGLDIAEGDGRIRVTCAHDGYRRLPGRVVHRRSWQLAGGRLTVEDRVEGRHGEAVAHFLFHPGWILSGKDSAGSAAWDSSSVHWRAEEGRARLRPASWHPEFGLSLPATRLELRLVAGRGRIVFSWDEG